MPTLACRACGLPVPKHHVFGGKIECPPKIGDLVTVRIGYDDYFSKKERGHVWLVFELLIDVSCVRLIGVERTIMYDLVEVCNSVREVVRLTR